MTQFVDWELATRTARTLGRSGPKIGLEEAVEAVERLRANAESATGHVAEFTGLRPSRSVPARVVDRGDWAAANVAGLSKVLDPLARQVSGEASWATRMVGSRVAGTQAGAVLGYLSSKVLGQYEIFDREHGQLLLIAPNIVEAERELDVDPADFRMWVCLHEATHSAQFGGVSWLREYFMTQINAFGAASGGDDNLLERSRRALAVLADSVRDGDGDSSVVDLVTSPGQREIVDRLTALMTLLEGHADYVMDEVGPSVVSDVSTLRERFDQRRVSGGVLQRLARRLLGVDVKLRQYSQGKKFTTAVVDAVGMDDFNRVWDDPANLPTSEEIETPDTWIARVVG